MKRTFVELSDFKDQVESLKDKDLLRTIQNELLKDPEIGAVITATGGIRKFRVGAQGKGKSGGIRVFYLDVPTKEECYLIFLLKKSEAENIRFAVKKELKKLADKLKK